MDPSIEYGIRFQAMQWAMSTAFSGEAPSQIMTRANTYADWILEPMIRKATSDAMGDVRSAAVN